MRKINCSIKGVSPLLQNRFVDTSETRKTKQEYNDKDETEIRLYKDSEGVIYQPSEHIERSMQKAGANFKYKGRKTYLDFIKAGVFITPDFIPHKNQNYETDKRPVNIQKNKIMKCRPIFKEWELDFQIEVINPDIADKTLNEILVYAGSFVGIGDYRPKFGRFILTKFELEK